MKVWLTRLWDVLWGGFWFVPSLMMIGATALALLLCWVDSRVDLSDKGPLAWLLVNAQTARSSLSLLSGAMITLSGVVFSITMVTLSMTSSQFGSRLLRTVMTDVTTSVALGAFVSTALYCLVVQRFIPADAKSPFVPHLAVFVGGLASLASLVMMIVFVHHVSVSIQAQNVVAEVARDLDAAVDRTFPDEREAETPEKNGKENSRPESSDDGQVWLSPSEGYLQGVDVKAIRQIAIDEDLQIEVVPRIGEFVTLGRPLTVVHRAKARSLAKQDDEQAIESRIRSAFITGSRRTPRQDVGCAVDELVEIAVRALSPGINDPFTAVTCIDRLAAAMSRLATREFPGECHADDDGNLRVLLPTFDFADLVTTAFEQIRHYGCENPVIARRLLQGFAKIALASTNDCDRQHIDQEAEATIQQATARAIDSQQTERDLSELWTSLKTTNERWQ